MFIERRGHGTLAGARFGRAYWQDHLPVREAPSVVGHAVRQLYLDCGAVDVAVELGDRSLLDAVLARWRDMVATRMYLTGALGSRHRDEAFGDPFELPPDRAYAETCAAIASVMLAWRLLLATGEPACADVIERTLYNGILPALSLDGTAFFYVNPLQRRTHRVWAEAGTGERASWYACACCPPNLMRLIGSWQQLLATTDETGIQIHQYASADIHAETAAGALRLSIETDYPWGGAVRVTVEAAPDQPVTLSFRIPAWCDAATLRDDGVEVAERTPDGRAIVATRTWRAGDSLLVDLPMSPRVTRPDPRVDAVRGCIALERGPLVYCIETSDLPSGVELEDISVAEAASIEAGPMPDLAASLVGLRVAAHAGQTPVEIGAIPYYAWANRVVEGMRVWIPATPADASGPPR
jgi:DUF1680 family protein